MVSNKDADETAPWMRRLVCAFVVRMQLSQVFSRQGPYELLILSLLSGITLLLIWIHYVDE